MRPQPVVGTGLPHRSPIPLRRERSDERAVPSLLCFRSGRGAIVPETLSTLVDSGYISQRDVVALKKAGAIGDVFSYFIDHEGNVVRTDLYDRMVTIGIDQVRKIPCSIGVAVGAQRARAVAAAVQGGFVNTLIVDKSLADGLLGDIERGRPQQGVRCEQSAIT